MKGHALRSFLAVTRCGSIRGAAAALRLAPSAVSRQVAELEAEAGQPLLERLPRGVQLTEAGRAVAEHAQRQEEEATALRDHLRRLRGGEEGVVRLCCGEGFLPGLMEQGLPGFAEAHPGLRYAVQAGGTDRILAAVAEGEADLGLAYNPPAHPALASAARARQPLVALLPPRHPLAPPLAGQDRPLPDPLPDPLPLAALAREKVALLSPGHGIRHLLARAEADGGFRLDVRLETGSVETLRRFALAGMGLTFLPEFAAAGDLAAGRLRALPLADPLLAEASAHLLHRAGRRLPRPAALLAEWLAARLDAFRPVSP
ncbi:LysR substrate-binding domain-containing protein [Roseomonas sp. GC11]|uniref:LysR family transcriptional regulator n=1 Tax=Roseomonas sp. GC11 TaxID=2950546 RepID=UPI00210B1C96|nr:LysR substrate-binding domain-containing protein [Roseomonas sp. GC11]MCQ4159989.1 LysR substrate-binding domain-containing protein [Roseomonas sp. GC11]